METFRLTIRLSHDCAVSLKPRKRQVKLTSTRPRTENYETRARYKTRLTFTEAYANAIWGLISTHDFEMDPGVIVVNKPYWRVGMLKLMYAGLNQAEP